MLFLKHRSAPQTRDERITLNPRLHTAAHCDTPEVFRLLRSMPQGLTRQEAARRLAQCGENTIPFERAPTWWFQLVRSFATPFIAVLLILGLVSLVTDVLLVTPAHRQWTKIILLALMIGISSLLRFWQEYRSQRAVDRLKALVPLTVSVSRPASETRTPPASPEGTRHLIPLATLVPGDVVYLAPGNMIPADVRFLQCKSLYVSQASVTGESEPVEKYGILYGRAEKTLYPGDEKQHPPFAEGTLGFMGTTVVSGSASAIVVTTGKETLFSQVAASLSQRRTPTSFDRGVNQVSWLLLCFMLVMAPVVFVINGLAKGDWGEALIFALAVAVGLTPEMLPLIVTSSLAKGALTMARQQVIVKRLPAMQDLGAMDLLCTDKTGTLTQDHITLVKQMDARGEESLEVLRLAYFNSAYQHGAHNLIDHAIVEHWRETQAHTQAPGVTRLDELPFDVFRRRMSVPLFETEERKLSPMHEIALPYTKQGQHVLELAREEALALQHYYIGPEHLLLGILAEGSAAAPLAEQGITLEHVRSGLLFLVGRDQGGAKAETAFTPQARHILAGAEQQTQADGEKAISPHYILSALQSAESEYGITYGLLQSLGVERRAAVRPSVDEQTNESALALADYLRDLTPTLSPEQERQLAHTVTRSEREKKRAEYRSVQPDSQVIEEGKLAYYQLFMACQEQVFTIIKEYLAPGRDVGKLLDAANRGLTYAIYKFGLKQQVPFRAYASHWIHLEIMELVLE